MLPLCDRTASAPRKDVAPVWSHSFPISKVPTTLGQHLRKKRFDIGMRQSQAALKLEVSNPTLSLWETDRLYPTWPYWSRIVEYLGFDPFTDPTLGRPKGNESSFVANLAQGTPMSMGQQIMKKRLEMRKTRKQMAAELGVDVKTLLNWERGRCTPSNALAKKVEAVLKITRQAEGGRE